jgi:class 3 adenylate cyclase
VEEQLFSYPQKTLKERELEIVLAIDRVRDTAPVPTAMFSGILNVLADQFQADFCFLYLVNRETSVLELRVVNERTATWSLDPALVQPLAEQAVRKEGVSVWRADEALPPDSLAGVPSDLQLVAIPVVMDIAPLGALLIGRAGRPFGTDEVELLKAAESQVDSAVIQAYTYHELQQRNKELETIYRVDRIRDQNLPFDEMLDAALHELCAVIHAESGFVMLYDYAGQRLEMRAVTPKDFLNVSEYNALVNRVANEALECAEMTCYSEEERTPCMVICVPLILRNEIIGVFGALNRERPGFTSDDRKLLQAIVSQMDTAIFEGLERTRLRRVLGRSLDPHVLDRLLANPNVDILKGERAVLTVLYGDLRGSTSLAEHLNPDLLVELISDYLGQMTNVVLAHEGTLDKFVGDEVMAVFGAPVPQPDHALRAVRVGLAMQAAHQEVIARWRARDVQMAGLGIGVATGELIVGEIGCEQRTDYTVIGRAANLGARICAVAHSGQVLISQSTYDLVKDRVEVTPIPGQHFKGIDDDVTVYHVTRLLEPSQ